MTSDFLLWWRQPPRNDASTIMGMQTPVAAALAIGIWVASVILGIAAGGVLNPLLYIASMVVMFAALVVLLSAPRDPLAGWATACIVLAPPVAENAFKFPVDLGLKTNMKTFISVDNSPDGPVFGPACKAAAEANGRCGRAAELLDQAVVAAAAADLRLGAQLRADEGEDRARVVVEAPDQGRIDLVGDPGRLEQGADLGEVVGVFALYTILMALFTNPVIDVVKNIVT